MTNGDPDDLVYGIDVSGAVELPASRYRCNRGHAWESVYSRPGGVVVVDGIMYCSRCIADWLRGNIGTVSADEEPEQA